MTRRRLETIAPVAGLSPSKKLSRVEGNSKANAGRGRGAGGKGRGGKNAIVIEPGDVDKGESIYTDFTNFDCLIFNYLF